MYQGVFRREKLLPWGIPVREKFGRRLGGKKAREICQLPQDGLIYLVISGSMGFGKIEIFVLELARRLKENEEIVVICGNNKKLEETLKRELRRDRRVRILGFTEQVAEYMEACDVIFTKPGGLSSTEAAVSRIPSSTQIQFRDVRIGIWNSSRNGICQLGERVSLDN